MGDHAAGPVASMSPSALMVQPLSHLQNTTRKHHGTPSLFRSACVLREVTPYIELMRHYLFNIRSNTLKFC